MAQGEDSEGPNRSLLSSDLGRGNIREWGCDEMPFKGLLTGLPGNNCIIIHM